MPMTAFDQRRFRFLATVEKGRLPSKSKSTFGDDGVPYLTMEYLRGEVREPVLVPLDAGLVLADEGDLLLLWDGSNAGEFLRAKRGVTSSTTALITPRGIDHGYFYWACKSLEKMLQAEVVGMGIPHVNGNYLANLPVPVPDTTTQQRSIAQYLDYQTTRIDAMVAAKERLLELLAEKRQALIFHAVTRGLDANAPLQDSGIPWLGEIPAHWQTERARWLFRERDERTQTGKEELLTVSHLTGVTPRSEKDVNMFEAETRVGYKLCRTGDLVVNTLWAWMGAMGVAPMGGIVSPAYNVYQPLDQLEPDYVDNIVRLPIFAQEVMRYSKGVWSSRLRLYPEGFFEVWFSVPPLYEQRDIVRAVAIECRKLDDLSLAAQRTINLLKERRSSLISGVVTGQIDIGSAA